MKPLRSSIIAVALLLCAAPLARGQQPDNRVVLGVGFATMPELLDGIGDGVLGLFGVAVGYRTEPRSVSPAVGAQYERFVSGRVAALGAGGVQRVTSDVFVGNDHRGTLRRTYGHVTGGLNVHYLRGRTAGVYSGASAGVGLRRESSDSGASKSAGETEVQAAGQLTALGLRVRQPVGAFVELGWGFRGLLALGLAYEF